ncbi:MAG: hypothetical protein GQ525_10975, partial [Draconibacterium sp.]|nr:hypothetical protein [Draconibacterium sp.]
MIVKMHKYTFLVYYREYEKFLESLQQLGVLHVVERKDTVTDEIKQKYILINQFEKTIQILEKRENKLFQKIKETDGINLMREIISKQTELETLELELDDLRKKFKKAKPWGNFSSEIIKKLDGKDIILKFLIVSKKKCLEFLDAKIPLEIVSEQGGLAYIVIVQKRDNKLSIDADEVKLPELPASEINIKIDEIVIKIEQINKNLDLHAGSSVLLLEQSKNQISNLLNFETVISNTSVEADKKLMVLEGWVPTTQKISLDEFLQRNSVLFVTEKAMLKDRVPILLKNNRFSKLFEPVGSMFSLPAYSELDLTIFFAPFFMMFFGFCLGDAGYGLLFIIGAGLYK